MVCSYWYILETQLCDTYTDSQISAERTCFKASVLSKKQIEPLPQGFDRTLKLGIPVFQHSNTERPLSNRA
jgi:hypothetical protein